MCACMRPYFGHPSLHHSVIHLFTDLWNILWVPSLWVRHSSVSGDVTMSNTKFLLLLKHMWWQGWKEEGKAGQTKVYVRRRCSREKQDEGDGRMEGACWFGACGGAYSFPCHVREGDTEQSPGERGEWMRGAWKNDTQGSTASANSGRSGCGWFQEREGDQDQAGDEPGQTSWESHAVVASKSEGSHAVVASKSERGHWRVLSSGVTWTDFP